MPTTFPAVAPSQASNRTTTPDILKMNFGNGYEQRMANGINYLRDNWQVSWEGLNVTDRNKVVTFLQSISAGDYFTWTTPFDGASKKFVLDGGWSMSDNGGVVFTINATFRQVFDA